MLAFTQAVPCIQFPIYLVGENLADCFESTIVYEEDEGIFPRTISQTFFTGFLKSLVCGSLNMLFIIAFGRMILWIRRKMNP